MARKIRSFSCPDGFCGADDCKNCHPLIALESKEENYPYEPRDRDEENDNSNAGSSVGTPPAI